MAKRGDGFVWSQFQPVGDLLGHSGSCEDRNSYEPNLNILGFENGATNRHSAKKHQICSFELSKKHQITYSGVLFFMRSG